jgi:hypothetical protein
MKKYLFKFMAGAEKNLNIKQNIRANVESTYNGACTIVHLVKDKTLLFFS